MANKLDNEGGRILGTVGAVDGKGVVRMEDMLDANVEDVWSALTDPARLARWYGGDRGRPAAGRRVPRTPAQQRLGRQWPRRGL